MTKGFWRRHAWKFILALAAMIGLFGLGDVLRGVDADPAIPRAITGLTIEEMRDTSEPMTRLVDLQVRAGGVHLLVMSLLWAAVLLVPFRRGERWAWYWMWTFPGWSLAVAVSFLLVDLQPGVPPPPPAISGWVFFGLTSVLLLAAADGVPSREGFAVPKRPRSE